MIILNKILFIYLPAGLLAGFLVATLWFYSAPIKSSYYMNGVDHDPSHNAQYIGMAIPLYYLLAFLTLKLGGNLPLVKAGLISYGVAGALFGICFLGLVSAGFSNGHSNRVGGMTDIILKPIELYESLAMSITTSWRIRHFKEYILIPDVEVTRELAKAMEEVKAAADQETDPTRKEELLTAYEVAFNKINPE